MKGTNCFWIVVVIGWSVFFTNCKKADIFIPFDREAQLFTDSLEIAAYITSKGFDPSKIDTADNFLIYFIQEEGTGEEIEIGDIVSFNYILRDIGDSVLATTIRSVAIDNLLDRWRVSIDTVSREPLVIETDSSTFFSYNTQKFTLAQSSWTVLEGILVNSNNVNAAYGRGLVAVMKEMNVGGHAYVIIPSEAFLGGSEFLSPTIYVVEIFPVSLRKPK